MILNNTELEQFITSNPNTAMLRISPQITSLPHILKLCQYATDYGISFVVQVIPLEFSNKLWEYIEGNRFTSGEHLTNVADVLSSAGYTVYVPDVIEITNIINNFSDLDLGLAQAQKQKFKQCYSLLACSYSSFVKPFKKMCLFAVEGYEGIFFWMMEKHCLLSVSQDAIREPVFIPTIDRNRFGLPDTYSNYKSLIHLTNHANYNIPNAVGTKDELSLLHDATLDIIKGNDVSLQYFSYKFQFMKKYIFGYPLPEGVKLYEIVYNDKGNIGYIFSDIILEVD